MKVRFLCESKVCLNTAPSRLSGEADVLLSLYKYRNERMEDIKDNIIAMSRYLSDGNPGIFAIGNEGAIMCYSFRDYRGKVDDRIIITRWFHKPDKATNFHFRIASSPKEARVAVMVISKYLSSRKYMDKISKLPVFKKLKTEY